MRTREKFYKNLSEFNVGHEKRVERFEFQDVKTLDGLSKKAEKLTNDLFKAIDKYLDADIEAEAAVEAENKALDIVEEKKDELQKIRQENNKREENQQKNIDIARKNLEKMEEKSMKIGDKFIKAEQTARGLKSQAEQLVDQMNGAISSFESSAKALGVDVSANVSKYNTAMQKLNGQVLKLR